MSKKPLPFDLERLALQSWNDLVHTNYDTAKNIAEKDVIALQSRDTVDHAARRHAAEILDPTFQERHRGLVLEHLAHEIKKNAVHPIDFNAVRDDLSNAVTFQRLKTDKNTGSVIHGTGRIVESVTIFPNNYRIRMFHKELADADSAHHAQKFYSGIVDYARQQKITSHPSSTRIANILHQIDTILPLSHTASRLDNVFVNGQDGQEYFSKQPLIERIMLLHDMNDIGLTLSYFSRDYAATKEGAAHTVTRWLRNKRFPTVDYKREIIERILLPLDAALQQEVSTIDDALIETLAQQDHIAALFEALNIPVEISPVYQESDPHIGNVQIRKSNEGMKYTPIDTDIKQDDIVAQLFERWALAGVYTANGPRIIQGKSIEKELLNHSYATLKHLDALAPRGELPTPTEFHSRFSFHKKKFLLRLARRYKLLQEKDEDPTKMQALSRFFYTAFIKETALTGAAEQYLSTLFGTPLSREKMGQIDAEYNPFFSDTTELQPLRLRNLGEEYKGLVQQHRRQERVKKAKKWGVGAVVLGLTAAAGMMWYANKDLGQEAKRWEQKAGLESEAQVLTSITGKKSNYKTLLGSLRYEVLNNFFSDYRVKKAAYLDLTATIEAIGITQSQEWKTVEPYLKEHHPALYETVSGLDGYIDRFMWNTNTKDVEPYIKNEIEEAVMQFLTSGADRAESEHKKRWGTASDGKLTMGLIPIFDRENYINQMKSSDAVASLLERTRSSSHSDE